MSESTTVCAQVHLSDFARNLQVCSIWGVHRLCKALEKVSEGILETCIPSKIAEISQYLWDYTRVTPQHIPKKSTKTPSSQHCPTLEELLEQYCLATQGCQKTRVITPDTIHDRIEHGHFTSAGKNSQLHPQSARTMCDF